MARPRVEFTDEQEREIDRLFMSGKSTKEIGKLYKCGVLPIQRVLWPRHGDLRTAAGKILQDRKTGRSGGLNLDYREGFEAGVRQALTLVNLHGIEAVRAYCNHTLLPWRDEGKPDFMGNVVVPAFRS